MPAYLLFNWLDTFCSMAWVPPGRMIRLIRSIDFCWPLPAVIKYGYFRQFAASLSFAFCIPGLSSLCAFAGTFAWTSCISIRDGLILNGQRPHLLCKWGVAPTPPAVLPLSCWELPTSYSERETPPCCWRNRILPSTGARFPFSE